MDWARWQRIQQLFHDAAGRPEAERRGFLEAACDGDSGLMAEVLAMLEEDARADSLLDRGLADVARHTMRDGPMETPAAIGPYRILGVLGEGGMGVVYLGERRDLGGRVAVKVLRDAWLSPARRERFANEQRTLVQLDHPAIAVLHDAGVLPDGTPWFSMEHVEGQPLTAYCALHATSIEQRLRLFREVCEAVQHAHRHLVVHRDLKPSNILVKDDGTVRLLDFGIARRIETLDLAADRTRTGLRLMTPAYAAPEQLRGEGAGVQTDIYALGVVLYELLTGRLPFDFSGMTAGEAEALILEHVPVRPSVLSRSPQAAVGDGRQLSRAAWADLDVLCPTAMHKDPARRYPTVEALIRDVDHYLKGEPLEARPDTLGYRLGKFLRRHHRAVTTAALTLVTMVAIVTFYTVRLTTARNEALAAAARTKRIQEFTLGLFEGGDPEAGPAVDLKVATLIDRGVTAARSLDGEPQVQAEMYQTLGGIYQKLGDLERADSLMSLALDRRRTLLGPDHVEVADSLLELGLLRLEQARYDEAETLIRDALTRGRRAGAAGGDLVAAASSALGQTLGAQGRYPEALEVLRKAARARQRAGDSAPDPTLADILYQLANVEFYAGHYDESESLNERILEMYRQLHGDRHPLVADCLINLGAIRFERGEYAEAESEYRQALGITEAWYGSDHPQTAANLTMLSRALVYQNKGEEATGLLQRALSIRERVYGSDHPAVASTLNELGNIAVAESRYDVAEASFARMLSIYRAAYPEGHYLVAVALANLASAYMNEGRLVEAEPMLREAVGIYEQKLAPDHPNTGIARIKLGRALLRMGRPAEAEPETRAGYEILSRQTSPSVSFLRAARQDLVAIYEALGQPDKAATLRADGEPNGDQVVRGR